MILQFIIVAVLILLAGMAEGKMDKIAFHNLSDDYFWGQNSWKNKYRNRDPLQGETFSGKYFVFLSDGFHLMKLLNHLCIFSAFAILLSINVHWHWWDYGLTGLCAWILRGVGFNFAYHVF